MTPFVNLESNAGGILRLLAGSATVGALDFACPDGRDSHFGWEDKPRSRYQGWRHNSIGCGVTGLRFDRRQKAEGAQKRRLNQSLTPMNDRIQRGEHSQVVQSTESVLRARAVERNPCHRRTPRSPTRKKKARTDPVSQGYVAFDLDRGGLAA